MSDMSDLLVEVLVLKAENENLRELLRRACNALSAFGDYVSIEGIERICALARKLGIEVDA